MTTAAQLIQQAYYLAKVLDPNEEIPPDYATEGLTTLNAIIDEWSGIGLYIPNYQAVTINTVIGQRSYTVNPVIQQVLEANLVDTNNVKFVLTVQDLKQFNAFDTTIPQGRPTDIFVENFDNTTPQNSTVYFFPIPDQVYTATIYCKQRLAELTYSATILNLPPFFFLCIEMQLAKLLSVINSTILDQSFHDEYARLMRELKAFANRDMSVINKNPYLTLRRYLPWGTYVG